MAYLTYFFCISWFNLVYQYNHVGQTNMFRIEIPPILHPIYINKIGHDLFLGYFNGGKIAPKNNGLIIYKLIHGVTHFLDDRNLGKLVSLLLGSIR